MPAANHFKYGGTESFRTGNHAQFFHNSNGCSCSSLKRPEASGQTFGMAVGFLRTNYQGTKWGKTMNVDTDRDISIDVSQDPDKAFKALHALYDNKQQWVRHYERLLAQVTPLSTTASLGIAAFVAENNVSSTSSYVILAVPFVLICFTLWFNKWCDDEIRRQFQQIVAAEKGMGFYEFVIDGQSLLPKRYLDSPAKTRPIIYAGYILQMVAVGVLLFVAFDQALIG